MSQELVTLNNNKIQLEVIPHIGGRIVSLKSKDSGNILSSDSSLWNTELEKPIKEYLSDSIMQFRGHSTWIGPQSQWWIHQDIIPSKKENKDPWPPDPFLDYGKFDIVSQTKTKIELKGPKSLFTGVQLHKSYHILDNGKIEIKSTATNIRNTTISWDLWFNTRLPGNCKSYVPISSDKDLRIETSPENEVLDHEVINSLFSFTLKQPNKKFNQISAKAFITPSLPYIFSFNEGYLFVIHIEVYNPKDVHPEQGMVEIYNAISHNNEDSLLELEYHAPYKKLEPNKSMEISETWELIKYNGGDSSKNQIKFIQDWIRKN